MRTERERKMREDEERRMRAEAQRQVEETAKRHVEEAERQMKRETERQMKMEADRRMREDRERQIREDAERQMKAEAERRIKEDAEARQRKDGRLKEDETRVVQKVSNMKKIEVRSSSSSFSEDDSLTIAHQTFSTNNLRSSTPPRTSLILHSGSSEDTYTSQNTAAMAKKASPLPSPSAVGLHVKASVVLESDSAATSDYSESDIGSPAVVRRAVPVHQVSGSSGSPAIIRKAIPVEQDSSHSSPGSEAESEASMVVKQAMPVTSRLSETESEASMVVRQAMPVASEMSEPESEAGLVRRAIPVPATDSDSAASSIASGLTAVLLKSFSRFLVCFLEDMTDLKLVPDPPPISRTSIVSPSFISFSSVNSSP